MTSTTEERHARAEALVRAVQRGDRWAANLLLIENNAVILRAARRTARAVHDSEGDDLLQVARLGVLRAVETFDWGKGVRFWSYAHLWMRSYVQRYVVNVGMPVRVPAHRVGSLLVLSRRFSWLDEPLPNFDSLDSPGHDHRRLEGLLATEGEAAALPALDLEAACKRVAAHALEHLLTKREATVLRWRFYVDPPATLQEIADEYGVSRERIRQVESGAMRKVRAWAKRCGAPVEHAPTFDDWVEKLVGVVQARREGDA